MIQSISNLKEFEEIREEWDRLYYMSGISNLFLTHQWLSNWIKYFGENRWIGLLDRSLSDSHLIRAVVLRVSGRFIGFIEPYHSHLPGILHLKNDSTYFNEILKYIKKFYRPKTIALHQSPKDDSFKENIQLSTDGQWFVFEKYPYTYNIRSIKLPDSMELYLKSKEKKVKHELERKNRKIEKDCQLILHLLNKPQQVDELFHLIKDIEKDSWKFRAGTAIISSEIEKDFYRDVFKIYSNVSKARAYVLCNNDIPIAYVTGIVFDGTYYALKTSYMEKYAKYSPGTVLFLRVLEEIMLNKEGISKIELLGEDARWKEELSTGGSLVCTYSLYPKNISSFLYILAYKYIRPRIEGALKRDPLKKILKTWTK